jgi:thiol-disulfide isomerase/thioredoxin
MHDLDILRESSEDVWDYLNTAKQKTDNFQNRLDTYSPDSETITKLRDYKDKTVVIVFSAEWCTDCYQNVPIIAQLNNETGLEVLVFGHLKRDSKNNKRRWSVPPSPPEVDEFNVTKIPHIIVLNTRGQVLGEIVENPPKGKTLEEAMLDILDASSNL